MTKSFTWWSVAALILFAGWSAWSCTPCLEQAELEVLDEVDGDPGDFAARRAVPDAEIAWRIPIASNGIYRLTQPQLLSAGIPAGDLIGSQVRLFQRDQEVARYVSTTNLMQSSDYIQFYGIKHGGAYTDTNVYWLSIGGYGIDMTARSGATNAGGVVFTDHCRSITYAPNRKSNLSHKPLDDDWDHMYAQILQSSSNTAITMDVKDLYTSGEAKIDYSFYGLTSGSHATRVFATTYELPTQNYSGPNAATGRVPFAYFALTNNPKQIRFQQGASGDISYLLEFTLHYPRFPRALGNALYFCGRNNQRIYPISGFQANTGFTVLDVDDPYRPVRLTGGSVTGSSGNYTLHFRDSTTVSKKYFVAADAAIVNLPPPEKVEFRFLDNTNRQADYIIITPYEFRREAFRLAKQKLTNGLTVAVAPITDVYNEFGYGLRDPKSIKQFIGYAYHHWQSPKPQFAVLIGEGSYDHKNEMGLNPSLTIPVKMGRTGFKYASYENWYGTVSGSDTLADVIVGRIPVSTQSQLSNVVAKIMAFEGSLGLPENATIVADNPEGSNQFWNSSDSTIRSWMDEGLVNYDRIYYLNNFFSPLDVRTTMTGNLNNGKKYVTYVGHGASGLWAAEQLWRNSDITSLSNSRYPVVAIFSCENGEYYDPTGESMGEVWIETAGKGAVACFAPTALSVQMFADHVAWRYSRELYWTKQPRLGTCIQLGLQNLWANPAGPEASELMTYQILGDPGLKVNP